MAHLTLIRNITRGFWFIDPEHAEGYLPAVFQLIEGKPVTSYESQASAANPFVYNPTTRDRIDSEFTGTQKIPEGSIAFIPVLGALMKDDWCGEPGTETIAKWIRQANENSSIIGIILMIDSPGGTVDGTQLLANAVLQSQKPVVSRVSGLIASAAYWIGSSSDHIMLDSDTAMVGSIGTMISIRDFSGYYEKFGIKDHNITADKSSDKNKVYLDARRGEYQGIKNELLNPMNEVFLSAVIANRGIDQKEHGEPLTGKIYLASKAIELKLADSIGSLDQAIQLVQNLATDTTQSSNSQRSNMLQFNSKFKALSAFAAKAKKGEAISAEEIQAVNDELSAAGITSHMLVESGHVAAVEQERNASAAIISQAIAVLEPEATEEEAAAYNLVEGVQVLTDSLTSASEEVTRLKALAPPVQKSVQKTVQKGKAETIETSSKNEFYSEADAELDAMLNQLNIKLK